jgi:general stress protein 26
MQTATKGTPMPKSLADIAAKMRGIDIAMLSTRTDGGQIASRPMSNNGDVEYEGESYYFTFEQSRTVSDIESDPHVALAFSGAEKLYIAVEGTAHIIRDKSAFRQHWTPDLDNWFENGADTPGCVMIKVSAARIKYWDGLENDDVKL